MRGTEGARAEGGQGGCAKQVPELCTPPDPGAPPALKPPHPAAPTAHLAAPETPSPSWTPPHPPAAPSQRQRHPPRASLWSTRSWGSPRWHPQGRPPVGGRSARGRGDMQAGGQVKGGRAGGDSPARTPGHRVRNNDATIRNNDEKQRNTKGGEQGPKGRGQHGCGGRRPPPAPPRSHAPKRTPGAPKGAPRRTLTPHLTEPAVNALGWSDESKCRAQGAHRARSGDAGGAWCGRARGRAHEHRNPSHSPPQSPT